MGPCQWGQPWELRDTVVIGGCICPGDSLCHCEGLGVREGFLSLWGSCQSSVIMSSLCHHSGSSRHWGVSVSWGLVSLGFCVFEGPCPITEFPRMKAFLCHFWDFIGKPCALWGPCASVGDICDSYVGICVLPGLLSLGLPLFWGAAVPRQPPLIMGFSVITGVLSLWVGCPRKK